MSTIMTQASLLKFFRSRGIAVADTRDEFNAPFLDEDPMQKGVSLTAILDGGVRLSMQGGGANYSTPRAFAEEYTTLEIAIISFDQFVPLEGDDVLGWADFEKIMFYAAKYDERILLEPEPEEPPVRASRKDAPWDT
jgi:hypothetical protein